MAKPTLITLEESSIKTAQNQHQVGSIIDSNREVIGNFFYPKASKVKHLRVPMVEVELMTNVEFIHIYE